MKFMKNIDNKPVKILSFIMILILTVCMLQFNSFVYAADDTISASIVIDGITYDCSLYTNDKTASIIKIYNPDSAGPVSIPSGLIYEGTSFEVTKIQIGFPYEKCTNITQITIPDTIDTIKGNMGSFCNVESITIPGSVKVFDAQFQDCNELKTITFSEGVEEIASNSMVNNLPKLKEIKLPKSLKLLSGAGIFSNAPLLESISLPEGVNITQDACFKECTSLKEVVLPASVTTIESETFNGCAALQRVTAKGEITSIGKYAFNKCSNLTSIPDLSKATFIGANAFDYCYSLQCRTDLSSSKKITFNNSKDNIKRTQNLPKDGEIMYLQGSIEKAGDNISSDVGAKTLQQAVNESQPGDTITISNDVTLLKTLIIPSGKDVIIKSEAGQTILADKDSKIANLIKVEEGASVTFEEIKISGAYNSNSIIQNKGKLTIEDNTVIHDGNINYPGGIIRTDGKSASITINGGKIEKNTINNQISGVVYLSNGATLTMNKGEITGNIVKGNNNFNSSAGIYLTNGATGVMNGGIISGNTANRGSAIMLYNPSISNRTNFTIAGGQVSDNKCVTPYGGLRGSGAIHIEGNCQVEMTGGKITANTGVMGAGVCAVDYGLQTGDKEMNAAFILDGGEISNNTGWTGAGIYSYTNGVRLLSGKIINNTASNHGGGVYSEGNSKIYSSIYIENALITDNTAEQGGGLWFCPTGTANISAGDEVIVYNNKATGAGDDFVSADKDSKYTVTLPDRLKSGERIYWYKDGGITAIGLGGYQIVPRVNKEVPRYDQFASAKSPISVKSNNSNLALKVVGDQQALESAGNKCKLLISGNKAAHGGGIAANGGVEASWTGKKNLVVNKVWNDGGLPYSFNKAKPKSVDITLVIHGKQLDSVTLNEENNWTASFTDIAGDLPLDEISILESPVEGFEVSYSIPTEEDGEISITATNTYKPPTGSLLISKSIHGKEIDESKEFTFTITLDNVDVSGTYGDITFEKGIATIKLKSGEEKEATGIPAGVGYSIVESDNEGYTPTVNGTHEQTASGTIVANKTETASFVNIQKGYIDVSVSKIWKDYNPEARPKFVYVQLFKDGTPFGEKVLLNEANGWKHIWSQLEEDYVWSVDEMDVPEGYFKDVTNVENNWTIKNYKKEVKGESFEKPKDYDESNPPEGVKTGDDSKVLLWVLLFLSSLCGIAILCERKIKNMN